MPHETDRQWATDIALELIVLIRLMETVTLDADLFSDSNDESEADQEQLGSDSGSEDSEEQILEGSLSMVLIRGLADLHSRRYLIDRRPIQKSTAFTYLLTQTWKTERPNIFRSYLFDPHGF
ncbi:hypothetical protein GGX14DRAFT_387555 [Mycena pura]|uniref:Uncharacterized protein n=1 Tax=Mycena pura TaxID=153505 RepID=A0AAD6YM24_9AGAR|nr:hypothetical protein GGX14DRAFT_387555 [Mycena pura]